MAVKNFKVKNGLTVGTGSTIYGNGNIDVAGIITAATFKGDGSGLINVTALGTGIQINNNGSIIGIGSIIDFGTNIAVSPVFAGITTITGSTNPIPGISTTGSSFFNELQVGAAATFSGEVEVADYIRHKGDTNTAIRFPTDDTFSVVTGSLERFRVESDGEIGIGTDTPRAKLDVDGTIYSAGNIKLYDNVKAEFGDSADLQIFHDATSGINDGRIVDTAGHLKLETSTDKNIYLKTGATQKINLTARATQGVELNYDGNLRLKTTGTGVDISDTLNVAGVSTFTNDVKIRNTGGVSLLSLIDANNESTHEFGTPGNGDLRITVDKNDVASGQEFQLYMRGNDTEDLALHIDHDKNVKMPNGKVGIGTVSPDFKLHSKETGGSTIAGLFETNQSDSFISFQASGTTASSTVRIGAVGDDFVAYVNGGYRFRIDSAGNVGVGGSVSIGGTSTFNGNVGISSALFDKDGDKGSSGQVLSSTGSQVNWINVGSIAAGAASSIAVGTNNSTDETVYPLFADGTSGNQGAEVDTGLTYNPSTGVLTATQFTGALSGNASGNAGSATQLQTARNIGGVSFNGTANIDLPGVNAAGNQNTSGTAAGLSGTPDITVDEIGTRNINVSGVTTTAAVNWGGHMLPTSNAAYDIGSAELKVRHLFLSDNSLKFVDSSDTEHPLSLDSGKLKFGGGLLLGNTIKADSASGILTATSFSGGGNDIVTSRWTIGANGSSDYTFTGPGGLSAANDPTIYLTRGQTYEFVMNTGGAHPFQIRVSNGGSAYNTGVTNNGSSSGTIKFEVPFAAPNTLVYQCTAHSGMVGNIVVHPSI